MRPMVVACALAGLAAGAPGQQVWSGYDFEFEKVSFSDWTLPENQDRITDTVWITRQNSQGIFNIFSEPNFLQGISPGGTEWAFGLAEDWQSLFFDPWQVTIGGNPPSMVGQAMAVHLIDEDIYLDLMFTDWTSRDRGGGFAYLRATPAPATAMGLIPVFVMATRRRR